MTLKTYNEPNDPLPIIDGPDDETGGEPRKLGLLIPDEPPKLYATLGDTIPLLDESEIRKILSDSNRMSGRKLFGPTVITDQDGRGACQGYAQAGVISRARARRGYVYEILSGDFAYAMVNGGRDGGSHLAEGWKSCEFNGTPTEATVQRLGLRHQYIKSRFPQECFEEAKRFKGFECYHIDTEQELLTACALGFDCVVAVQAGGSGSLDRYGIVGWGNGSGNHAVLVDDAVYDTQMGGWKFDMANSWSTRWGSQGRCYLTWGRQLSRSSSVHRFYAVRSTGDDPQGDNPPTPKP